MAKDKDSKKTNGNETEDPSGLTDFDFDLEGTSGLGIKVEDSAQGLLDDKAALDDSVLGGVFDDLYNEELPKKSKKPKNYTAFRPDEAMNKLGWKRHNRIYYKDGIAIAFIQKKDAPIAEAYVLFGYWFKNFVEKSDNLKSISCQRKGTTMPLHDLIRGEVKVEHLKVDGRKPFARVYDRGNAGIALGYSVAYDPNTNSDGQIQTVSTKAREVYSKIETTLNDALTHTKKGEVEYIPALDVVGMYRKKYRKVDGLQEKVEPLLPVDDSAQIGDLGLEIKKAEVEYTGQQTAKRRDVSEKEPPWYGKLSALWPFGKKEKSKKPKQ